MKTLALRRTAIALAIGCTTLLAQQAGAATQSVAFTHLVSSATIATPLLSGDTLFLDTFTTEVGALSQVVTFTVGAGVLGVIGGGAWETTTAAGPGPRLVGVNLDIFDAANNLVTSDGAVTSANGFATSPILAGIGPGTYTLRATGTGVRDSSLDVSLSFTPVNPVPEPETYAMMLAGLGVLGFLARRRAA